jgi:DNA repair protein RecO (recombination protein O)
MQQFANGIVLHNVRYADKKIISKIFTKQLGLVTCHVVISSSPKAKLKTSTLQPLHLIEMEMQVKQNKEVQQLLEARCYYVYKDLTTNFSKLTIAQFINEILIKTIKEHQVNEHLFEFIETCLKWLDEHQANFANLHLYFLIELSKYLGIEPFNNYSAQERFFNSREGKFLTVSEPFPLGLDESQSRLFNHFLTIDILSQTISKTQRLQLLEILIAYYQVQIPNFGTLKSLDVLKTVLSV